MENDFKNLINADNASAYANSKEKKLFAGEIQRHYKRIML
jgi:hypothetical protein